MTTSLSIDEAQRNLDKLVKHLSPGDEIVILDGANPVARIISTARKQTERQLGTLRGSVAHMASDFDAPLEDFAEHMS